jgi:hypothetical protein
MRINQFPIINAISVTTYKVQGDSLAAMVVSNWRANSRADKPEQGYLLVSRALTRYGFLCLEPLTIADTLYFRPSDHCLEEDIRLNLLSDTTEANFYADN